MKPAPVVKTVGSGVIWVKIRRYSDNRFGFDYDISVGKRFRVRAVRLEDAAIRANELVTMGRAGTLDALAFTREDIFSIRRWQATQVKSKPVPALVESYLLSKADKGLSYSHLAGLRHSLKRFAAMFVGPIDEIRREEVEAWLNTMQVSPRSSNNHLERVKSLFIFAKNEGYLAGPTTPVDRIEPKVVSYKIEIYSPDEIRRILRVVPNEWLPAIVFGAFAGLRPEEICPNPRSCKPGLLWENIDWKRKNIEVPAPVAKVRSWRTVEMCDALLAFLEPFREKTGPVAPRVQATKMYARWVKDSGVPWKSNGLRHSYASYRYPLLKDIGKLANEMGNSPAKCRKHYLRHKYEEESAEWFAIRPGLVGR